MVVGSDAQILSGALTARFYPFNTTRVRPWLSAGLRAVSLRPDDGTLSIRSPFDPGAEIEVPAGDASVALSDVEKVDLVGGLGIDLKLSDHFDLSVSGDQGLDLGWNASVRLVYRVGARGCGRCPKGNETPKARPQGDDDDDDEEEDCGPFLPGEAPLASIETPPMTARRPLAVDPGALPAGARARFPAYDGDSFFVTFPENRPSPENLREKVIAPTLRALGFEAGPEALREPPAGGVTIPAADFTVLAEAVQLEAASDPGFLLPGTPAMIDVLVGGRPPDAAVNAALESALGMSFDEFVADVTRREILYPFHQVHDGTPIEHTLLLASRWPGEGIASLQGSLIYHYVVVNEAVIDSPAVVANQAMQAIPGVQGVELPESGEGPVLVLLPYGSSGEGIVLRYAYRMILLARFCQQDVPFLLWLDAEDGTLLKLEPLASDAASETPRAEPVGARAAVYNRDPGVGTTTAWVQVDPPRDGKYSLQNAEGLARIDFQEDGFDELDVAIPDDVEGSGLEVANFDQYPINDASQALCDAGTNKHFQQVHFFASLMRYRRYSLALGVDPVFSLWWKPGVESPRAGCNAWSNMSFGVCQGYLDPACPDYSDGSASLENCMNFAQDNTVIAHEMGHNVTYELTNRRPAEWCGDEICAIPIGWRSLHELADFWADHFESTNCIAGWTCKNVGGVDASLGCRSHSEAAGMPRLHELSVPFDPGAPGDHFPEHRRLAADEYRGFAEPEREAAYADMQIGAAALWQLQLALRSKSRSAGLLPFAPRLARALRKTGFDGFTPEPNDLGIYRYLHDLEEKLVEEWASPADHDGAHLAHEVTASFARAGLFLVPYQCLDADPASHDSHFCPSGGDGGDAVIDVDDNDPGDDYEIRGVRHPEADYLEIGGPPPTFHVWTGPLYRFDSAGAAELTGSVPCNGRYRVEASTDPTFPPGETVDSGQVEVSADPGCYGAWTPTAEPWRRLQAGGPGTRLYYRVTTWDGSGGNPRISTAPGNGQWPLPPPYVVLTDDGTPRY
jgi:hypothetical protein